MKKTFTNIRKDKINGESDYVINNAEASTPPQAPGSNLIGPKSYTVCSVECPPKVSEQSDSTSSTRSTLNADSNFLEQLTTAHGSSMVSTDESRRALEVHAQDSPWKRGDFVEGIFLEFPEIGLLVNELEHRLQALENVLSTAESADIAQDSNINRKVEMTTDQLDAINGISTNMWGILNGLNDHCNHFKSHRKVHREPEGGSYSRQFRRHSSLDVSPRSKHRIDAASNSSTQLLLRSAFEPEKHHWRHHTVFSSNSGMNFSSIGSTSKIPKELLLRIINLEPTAAGRSSVAYIAQTYGGVQLPSDFEAGVKKLPSFKNVAKQVGRARSFVRELQWSVSETATTGAEYIPPEFKRLGLDEQKQLARMLSWESLKVWGFNAFQLDKLSSVHWIGYDKVGAINDANLDSSNKFERKKPGCPILLMGWALLASPYAQLAMAREISDAELLKMAENAIKKKAQSKDYPLAQTVFEKFSDGARENEADEFSTEEEEEGYFFLDKFGITPIAICHFLRKVEKDYPSRDANPYHNNIHAADVMQTTHALIQMGGADLFCAFSCLEIFTILVAAALHDVQHPGTNNNYQINKQTDLAMVYNDHSVLENMHASRASYLLRESGGTAKTEDNSEGIFGKLSEKDRAQLRAGVIRSILSTDMSQHFKAVAKMKMYIDEAMDDIDNESSGSASVLSVVWKSEHSKLRERLLPFILHLADISNPTKSPDVSIEWSNSAYDEFFLQGDKEASEGMPISPLCDRSTTDQADGQVGFITYVVKPAFLLLQQCLPGINGILTQLDDNLVYWEVMKNTVKNNVGNQEME